MLLNGWREPGKDAYNHAFNHWNYAVRGVTLGGRTPRVIVAVMDKVIVITHGDCPVKKHIVPEYTDTGFGFPVIIQNVEMAQIAGETVALIDYKKLERLLIRSLPSKPARLSGAEIRFIRQYFGLTLEEFAKVFGVTHPAVKKWEASRNEPSCMATTTEMALRMWAQRQLSSSPRLFMKLWDAVQRQKAPLPKVSAPAVLPYSRVSAPLHA